MKRTEIKNMVLAALFLALAFVMPFITGGIPEIGAKLCPMHIPVLICGFICGWKWGGAVGIAAPLLRSVCFSMPPMFPTAVCMAFELAAYGIACGLLRKCFPKKKIYIYCNLLSSMILGRIVWGTVTFILLGFNNETFTLEDFWAGAIINAVPGIIVQIVLVPIIVIFVEELQNRGGKQWQITRKQNH